MTTGRSMTRRTFVEHTAGAAAIPLLATASTAFTEDVRPKLLPREPLSASFRIGVVGLGGRGSWIASLFKQHRDTRLPAVADYFEDTAKRVGDSLGVPAGKRIQCLSATTERSNSGVEALVLEESRTSIPSKQPLRSTPAATCTC